MQRHATVPDSWKPPAERTDQYEAWEDLIGRPLAMFEENGRLQARLLGREHPLHLRYPTGSAENFIGQENMEETREAEALMCEGLGYVE